MSYLLSVSSLTCASVICLVPAVMKKREINIISALDFYRDDLPSPDMVNSELSRWKRHWANVPDSDYPSTCAQTLKMCNKEKFPNVYTLLQIACTVAVTSCECERSASALRRLHNFNRACMSQDRLTSLGLIHIHYDENIDVDEAVVIFRNLHPRKMGNDTLLL